MTRYYIIQLIRGTCIYRVANDLEEVLAIIDHDSDPPDVIILGYCNSVDWLMEWIVYDALRAEYSGAVLELINQIRQMHPK